MAKHLFRLLNMKITKDVLVNTSGNYLNVFFTASYALILVRVFTPAEYGILSVLFAIAYLLTNIFDFGISANIYSHLPVILSDKQKSISFLKTNFIFQTILAIGAVIISLIFINPIDKTILKLNIPITYYILTFLAIPLFLWQNFISNALFASKKFVSVNISLNIANIVKVAVLLVLAYLNLLTIPVTIFVVFFIGQFTFFMLLLPQYITTVPKIISAPFHKESLKTGYTITFFFATQLYNIAMRMDLFLLSYFLLKADVGIYGLAQKIIISIITSINAITQVFSPDFASATKKSEVVSLFKRAFMFMLLPTGIIIASILTPDFIYILVFTKSFSAVAPVTRYLGLASIPFAYLAIVILFFLYTIKKPYHLLVVNIILLLTISTGCIYLIPKYKLVGPPIAIFIAYILSLFYIIPVVIKEFKKLK